MVCSADANMPRFKAALIDLSGTVHIGDKAIDGAIEACRKLYRSGIKVKFLTNTTTKSLSSLLRQLRSIGFDESAIASQDSIMTSAVAAKELLLRNNLKPLFLVENILLDDFAGLDLDHATPNCVLVGLSPSEFHYQKLNEAFRLLLKLKEEQQNNDSASLRTPLLIAIHRAKYFKDKDQELSLGPGGFVSLLEDAAGVTATVVGKPSLDFFQSAIKSMGVSAHETVMIGDDVVSDIGGALSAGLGAAILVRTGKYLEGDESKLDTKIGSQTTMVVDSVVDAVQHIFAKNKISA